MLLRDSSKKRVDRHETCFNSPSGLCGDGGKKRAKGILMKTIISLMLIIFMSHFTAYAESQNGVAPRLALYENFKKLTSDYLNALEDVKKKEILNSVRTLILIDKLDGSTLPTQVVFDDGFKDKASAVQMLLKLDAVLEKEDSKYSLYSKNEILSAAISRQNLEMINAMSEMGVAPTAKDLSWAMANGDFAFKKLLIEKATTVNSAEMQNSPLHVAAFNLDLPAMELLIGKNADVNAVGALGETPLHMALRADRDKDPVLRKAVVELLIRKGADVNARVKNEWGSTPLAMAVSYWLSDEMIEFLIEHGADVKLAPRLTEQGSLLHDAVDANRLSTAGLLIEKGADVNKIKISAYNYTPLEVALVDHIMNSKERKPMVRLLLDRGANPNIKGLKGVSWLYETILSDPEIAEALVEKGADVNEAVSGESLLQQAVREEKEEVVEFLVKHGLAVDSANNAEIAFSFAIEKQNKKLVDLLLARGANVDTATLERVFNKSIFDRSPEIFGSLVAHTKDVKNFRFRGEPAIFGALYSPELVEILIKGGANVNELGHYWGIDETPLERIFRNREREYNGRVIKSLLDAGAEMKSGISSPDVVLWVAIDRGWADVVSHALSKKVDLNMIRNSDPIDGSAYDSGISLVQLAVNRKNLEIAKTLVDKGALVDFDSEEQVNFVTQAYNFGKEEIPLVRHIMKKESRLFPDALHRARELRNRVSDPNIDPGVKRAVERGDKDLFSRLELLNSTRQCGQPI
jgi:cytohesin